MERRGITWARYFLLPGFCGGLTTFSGVTFEVMRDGGPGVFYLVARVIGSLIAVAGVMPISRRVIAVKP
jgi:CrcB protein